ncbi:hypothetical protein FB451DRAFT_1485063, partial [Mycena latifolia]
SSPSSTLVSPAVAAQALKYHYAATPAQYELHRGRTVGTCAPMRSEMSTTFKLLHHLAHEELKRHFPHSTSTRDALSAARLDYDRNWKVQKPDKFAMAYNAVEEKFAVLRRCEDRRPHHSPEPTPPASPTSPVHTPRWSLSPGPSQPRPHRPPVRHVSSSDVDGDDGLFDFNDEPGQRSGDEGEEESGRKHAHR